MIPGAFPGTSEEVVPATRAPKKRFVGRRTAESQAKSNQNGENPVEDSTAVVQRSKTSCNI